MIVRPLVRILSVITLWEVSLKFSLGRLYLQGVSPEALSDWAQRAGFQMLPLDPREALTFHELSRLAHKDPFDRMLVWQCLHNGCALISKDGAISDYQAQGLQIVW